MHEFGKYISGDHQRINGARVNRVHFGTKAVNATLLATDHTKFMSVNYIGSLDVCASDVPKKSASLVHILRSQLNLNASQRVHSDNKRGMQSSSKWHLFFWMNFLFGLKPKTHTHTYTHLKAM